MKAAAIVLFCALLLCPCLFAQQVNPNGRPAPTPGDPTQVLVTNADTAPVPVKVVAAPPEADMITIIDNAIPDPATTFIVDMRSYRSFSLMGTCTPSADGVVVYYLTDLGFLDSDPAATDPPPAYAVRNRLALGSPTVYCSNQVQPGVTAAIMVYPVAGPYLEIRLRSYENRAGNMTLKVYRQK